MATTLKVKTKDYPSAPPPTVKAEETKAKTLSGRVIELI
jgi:hypothetical protein